VSPSVTSITPIPSAPDNVSALRHEVVQKHGQLLPEDIIDHLVRTYGTRYNQVLALRENTVHWNQRVHTGSPVIHAELVHGVRHEMAHTADDLLRRRTELGARGVSDNAVLARIADVLGHELGRRA
jgi:glycerol-3-phosphate dehydrogenase